MATKTSLEITKGGSLVEPVPGYSDRPESENNEKDDLLKPFPTEEEWATLPRVAGTIPWTAWTVAFVEFAERFSYYGTSAVCMFRTRILEYKLILGDALNVLSISCKLHSEGFTARLYYWSWIPYKAGLRRAWHGPTCFNRNNDF